MVCANIIGLAQLIVLSKICIILAYSTNHGVFRMSVMVTLEIPVHKERLEDFLDVLREALKETRVYEGCQKVETFVEMDTGSVVLVELWETAEHQQAYLNWRIETGLTEALSDFLAGELKPRTFAIRDDV